MKKASQVIGLQLMGISEGATGGKAVDFMIDTVTKKVRYIVVQSGKGYFAYSALPVNEVVGVGDDYIITSTLDNIEEKDDITLEGDGFFMLGTGVISCEGNSLGKVKDFSFDEKEGTIETIELDNGKKIAGEKMVTLSELAFVDEAGSAEPAQEAVVYDALSEEPVALVEEVIEEEVFPAQEEVVEEVAVEEPSAFELEQREFLLGRTVVTDVADDDGTVLAEAGTVLTDEIIDAVGKAGKILDLTLSVE